VWSSLLLACAPAAILAQAPAPADLPAALAQGVGVLLRLQEGPDESAPAAELTDRAQWPYEGVYRVKGKIPMGYRVGGTAIAVMALVQAPGYAHDPERVSAVARSIAFICDAINHPLMSIDDFDGGYDVRIWGHIEALMCLSRLSKAGLIDGASRPVADKAIAFYLDGVQRLEMPVTGGWNYARPGGRETKGSPSVFVTGVALQALFTAADAGSRVDPAVIDRGLSVLEKARTPAGSMVYSGAADRPDRQSDGVPGATGRMTLAEATLVLAGRGSLTNVRGAVDAFIVHWEWLDKRRAKNGTHERPYMVAPYYFMFAHQYAAQAVELLPRHEREEYRRRINGLLFSVRQEDGSWNDRVFPRSAGYGTATAMIAMMAPQMEPARWKPEPPRP
jgi:hypothetical protein